MKNLKLFLVATLVFISMPITAFAAKTELNDTVNIDYIDLVQVCHTDYGFTDHPVIAVDLFKRYIDIALDLAIESKNEKVENRFCWTAEGLDAVYLWWQEASDARRRELLKMIDNKQFCVNSMPFHIHPFVNKSQWKEMINWIPTDLRKKFDIKIGMQHDVNGFPRSAAMQLLDKNVNHLWTGINPHWGGSPFPLPTAFWWKMPDNRKLFVYSGFPYWEGYTFFNEHAWRADQRDASNTQFSWPRDGDVMLADTESVKKAHAICMRRLSELKKKGYNYPFLTLSFTNQWRMDNDGPMPQLIAFVKKWNKMGLKPMLRMTTADEAMNRMEKIIGDKVQTLEGEWQDWWSFGLAASPRALQAARRAVQNVNAIESPIFGNQSNTAKAELKQINRMLCRYYEHTFASNETSSTPFSLFNLGQISEKDIFAYRPLERSKWLLAQQVRTLLTDKEQGLYVVNTGIVDYTGWIMLDAVGFRGVDYKSVKDNKGNSFPILREGNIAKIWVSKLSPISYAHFKMSTEETAVKPIVNKLVELTYNDENWIKSVKWDGMKEPLFTDGIADFMALTVNEMNRWALGEYIFMEPEAMKKKIASITSVEWATPKKMAKIKETPYSMEISQELMHPRLKSLKRSIIIYKESPRVKVKVEFDRISSNVPEVFYVKFPFPKTSKNPITTNGGVPYTPYVDHLPNSCKDFFVVDNWVKYGDSDGTRMWASKDVPLVNFGGHNFCTRIPVAPENVNELYGMLYNNVWVVNFLLDCPGEMAFEFDLSFENKDITVKQANDIVNTYLAPIPVMLNPAGRDNKIVKKHMNTPRLVTN